MNGNRALVRADLASLMQADGVIMAFAQAVYGYRKSDFDGQSPVLFITSAGSERQWLMPGQRFTDTTLRLRVVLLVFYTETNWTEAEAEARADWLDIALGNLVRANRAGSNWHYLDFDGPATVQGIAPEGGPPYFVCMVPLKARVLADTDGAATTATVARDLGNASRVAVREALAAAMTADATLSDLVQAVYAYRVSDAEGQSPVIVIASASTERTAAYVGGTATRTTMRIGLYVLVAYSDSASGWTEEDAEERLDDIDTALGNFVRDNRTNALWHKLDFEGLSQVTVAEEGGVPYFVETYTLTAQVADDTDSLLTDSVGALLLDGNGDPLTE